MEFIVIIKDVTDFGNVGLQGIHQVLESDRDVENILYNVDRDGFDRVFAYVRGFDDATFDVCELRHLLGQLEVAGGDIPATNWPCLSIWKSINQALTVKQFRKMNDGTLRFDTAFKRALKVSRRKSVRELAHKGLVYCSAAGWVA